jgi:hypothetical protein
LARILARLPTPPLIRFKIQLISNIHASIIFTITIRPTLPYRPDRRSRSPGRPIGRKPGSSGSFGSRPDGRSGFFDRFAPPLSLRTKTRSRARRRRIVPAASVGPIAVGTACIPGAGLQSPGHAGRLGRHCRPSQQRAIGPKPPNARRATETMAFAWLFSFSIDHWVKWSS